MKRCPKCATTKPLSEFYVQKSGRKTGQPTSWCKACSSEKSKAYYAANAEKVEAYWGPLRELAPIERGTR